MDQNQTPAAEEKVYELLSRAEKGQEITTRDDQCDFSDFLDAARVARRSGGRLRLIDTGRFSAFELEWLAEAGADLYTSDEARPNRFELGLLSKARARGNAVIAYFHHGRLSGDSEEAASSPAFLAGVGRDGVDIHISNRERPRDRAFLTEVGSACRGGGSRLVYYHHGPLEAGFESVVSVGGWIHLTEEALEDPGMRDWIAELARGAAAAGAGVILHIESGQTVDALKAFFQAGAFLIFRTPPSEPRSRLRAIEKQAAKRKLDPRSYYLHAHFLP